MVECVEPALIHGGLQSDPGFTVFSDGIDQTVAVDKIGHSNSHGRGPAGVLRKPAQGQQNDPLNALGLSIPLEQTTFVGLGIHLNRCNCVFYMQVL